MARFAYRKGLVIAAIVMAGCIALFLYTLFGVLASNRRIAAAFAHAEHLQCSLQSDLRFTNVTASATTLTPMVHIYGTVQHDENIFDLRDVVVKSHPPVPVIGDVHVGTVPTNRTWPVVAWKLDPQNRFKWIVEKVTTNR
jgi:hypothetical protein